MTNRKQAIGNKKRGGNGKDGHHNNRARTKAQQDADDQIWFDAGFRNLGAPRMTYTSTVGVTFEVSPGVVGLRRGLVARHPQSGKEILFAFEDDPQAIAAQLDDEGV